MLRRYCLTLSTVPFSTVLLTTVLVGGLLLGGCAGPRHQAAPTAGATPGASAAAPSHGIYKVGSPYQIDGVWYYPAEDFGYDETGIASWYGEASGGQYTANGETFDLNAVTAAHQTLPMPSVVEVTNLENGRSIHVRVNDRGPYARGRIIDLSRRAAQLLGFELQGKARVRVKILVPESIQVASLAQHTGGEEPQTVLASAPPKPVPVEKVVAENLPPPAGARVAPAPTFHSAMPPPRPTPSAPVLAEAASASASLPPPKVSVVPVRPTQIFIQAGAFARVDNAARVKDRLVPLGRVDISGARVQGIDVYRVRLGPIGTVDDADRLLERVVQAGLPEARIVID
jgi:rare lipoprotein A